MVKLLGVCLVMALFVMVSNEEYKELEFKQANPKYPNTGLIEKACLKTGAYCRMIANK